MSLDKSGYHCRPSLIFLRLKCFVIYFLALSASRMSQLQRYGVGKLGGDGNQIDRNVSSSEAIDPSSDSVSDLALGSESSRDV